MSSQFPPLKKPPAYRDPTLPVKMPPPPPSKVNLPPSFYPLKKRNSCCRRCCCVCLIVTVIICLFFISAGGFFYLFLEPRFPDIRITSIQFTNTNVTNSSNGPVLNAQTRIGVELTNPNKNLKMKYGRTEVSMATLGGSTKLGEATVPGFIQDKDNVTTLKITLNSGRVRITQKQANELQEAMKNKKLKMDADIKTGFGAGYNSWSTGTPQVDVSCVGMSLKQIEQGTTPNCHIKVLNRFQLY